MKVMILHENFIVRGLERYEIKEVDEISLAFMQNTVKGFIEHVPYSDILAEQKIDFWVNEEGKLLDLLPNIAVLDKNNKIKDILMGTVLITSEDEEDVTGLTDEQISSVIKYLDLNSHPKYYMKNNDNVFPVSVLKCD